MDSRTELLHLLNERQRLKKKIDKLNEASMPIVGIDMEKLYSDLERIEKRIEKLDKSENLKW